MCSLYMSVVVVSANDELRSHSFRLNGLSMKLFCGEAIRIRWEQMGFFPVLNSALQIMGDVENRTGAKTIFRR